MGFEKYIAVRGSKNEVGVIQIRKHGSVITFGFHADDIKAHFTAGLSVEYYFDRQTRQIGILPVKDFAKRSLRISPNRTVSAMGFVTKFGIRIPTDRATVPFRVENGFLVFSESDIQPCFSAPAMVAGVA